MGNLKAATAIIPLGIGKKEIMFATLFDIELFSHLSDIQSEDYEDYSLLTE